MGVGLCMVVKDESHQLADCLDGIVDCFEQRVFVDTGSRDGTPALIERRYGDEVLTVGLDETQCRCLRDPRIVGLESLRTSWVLFLDADERIQPDMLDRIPLDSLPASVGGLFGCWLNHCEGDAPFPDYKLFVFRRGLRPVGLIHDNVQLDIRQRGLEAKWHDELTVRHYPDPARRQLKDVHYRRRLRCAIALHPEFYRYHWFQGYMDFLAGDYERAIDSLARAAGSRSPEFPVECLNSHMVLADIHARHGREEAVDRALSQALAFYRQVAEDFEVRVNFRLPAWLSNARASLEAGALDQIRAYRFAC